ncbi:transcriptional regulator [Haloarcula sp. Atlit-47R]|nr:transcriptional regulator [Haloarcula sp. Atlit-47R]
MFLALGLILNCMDDTPQGREAARDRRKSMSPAERERVEQTVSELLDLLGKAHTMAILREFAFSAGPLRFSDLETELGISPNTLSERLKELVATGLLVRESYDEIPPRVEYEPTEKAEALFPAFGHFHRWAADFALESTDTDITSTSEVN